MDQAEKAKNLDTEKFNNQFYDYDFELSDFELSRIHKIVDMVGSHKRVLDIGCLDGTIGTFIQKKNNEVFGIDLSSAAVEKAQKKGIKASVGNAEKQLEFEDSSFDVICASEIIEHLTGGSPVERLIVSADSPAECERAALYGAAVAASAVAAVPAEDFAALASGHGFDDGWIAEQARRGFIARKELDGLAIVTITSKARARYRLDGDAGIASA